MSYSDVLLCLQPGIAEIQSFCSSTNGSFQLASVRFEPIESRLFCDLTLFNGMKLQVLFAVQCRFTDRETLAFEISPDTELRVHDVLNQSLRDVSTHWRRLRREQGTDEVRGLVDMIEISSTPLASHKVTESGLAERDVPGRSPYRNIVRSIRAYSFAMEQAKGRRVLDYGCGSGMGSRLIGGAASNVVGIDMDPYAIHISEAFNLSDNVRFQRQSVLQRGGGHEAGEYRPFDVITAFEVMEHADDPQEFLLTLERSLASDGTLILSVPNRQYHGRHLNAFHQTDFSLQRFADLLEQRFDQVRLFGQRASTSANPFDNYAVEECAQESDEHYVAICSKPRLIRAVDRRRINRPSTRLRVLMIGRTDAFTRTGADTDVMRTMKAFAEQADHDVEVDIILSIKPLADEHDLVHFVVDANRGQGLGDWGLKEGPWLNEQLQSVLATRAEGTPIVATVLNSKERDSPTCELELLRRADYVVTTSTSSDQDILRLVSGDALSMVDLSSNSDEAGPSLMKAYRAALNICRYPRTRVPLRLRSGRAAHPHTHSETIASIIVVTYNSAKTIGECLESVLRTTDDQTEIIVVDNASSDGTRTMMEEIGRRHPDRIRLIANATNEGFSVACNKGAQLAGGRYLIFLNPDTITTSGWLERMLDYMEKPGNENVGAVGPTSNYVAGLQHAAHYLDLAHLKQVNDEIARHPEWDVAQGAERMAAEFAKANRGRSVKTRLLIGFCWAISRKTFEKIGPLEHTMFLGNEDLDYSLRLRDAGYRLLIATDVFIHHHGQSSFSSLDPETRRRMMQQSLDALYDKLEKRYGEGRVPSSTELWGIDIMGIPTKRKAVPDVKVAIIYDNTIRPDTTGEYCKRALEKICHVTHYLPDRLGQLEDSVFANRTDESKPRFDLYLHIDDGLGYCLPQNLRPSAWWYIDSHLRYDEDLEKARQFDHVFTAQRDGAERLRRDGVNATWLPLACDPEIHRKHDVEKNYDIVFVGNTFMGTPLAGARERLLSVIHREFPKHFIGRRFFHEMAHMYSQSRIVFNCAIRNDVNMRVFEALACGSLLVTNDLSDNGQNELFIPGKHLVTYRNERDLIEKVRYYLDHPDEREAIAASGREEVLTKHTYVHRMEVILRGVVLSHRSAAANPYGGEGTTRGRAVNHSSAPSTSLRAGGTNPDGGERTDAGTSMTSKSLSKVEGRGRGDTETRSRADAARDQTSCAVDATTMERDLTSIVILCHNELHYTRQCIDSIADYTASPYELVLVDNGSTDGTDEYLLRVKESFSEKRACRRVVVATNAANLGFAKGCNQGIAMARGEYILLLNNDVIVTDRWLDRLLGLANSSQEIGAVGPRTNYASGVQRIDCGYLGIDQMHEYAKECAEYHRGQWFATERLVGLCLLINREALSRIGALDERFEIGMFEDDDLCLRLRKAGYQLAVAADCFVHHFGGRTFRHLGIDVMQQQYRLNMRKFTDKWRDDTQAKRMYASLFEEVNVSDLDASKRQIDRAPNVVATVNQTPAPPHQAPGPTVSLCMIVKNEEKNLATCLQSVHDLFDEIVIVDTGSTDRTKEIAAGFPCVKLFDFPWVDDFSAARNVSLEHATSDWIMWLDADDRIDAENREKLRKLFASLVPLPITNDPSTSLRSGTH